jgi:hypothetical protein
MNDERYVFPSACPKCGRQCPQESRIEELHLLLARGSEISAYCITCDEHWHLSAEERNRLARNLE